MKRILQNTFLGFGYFSAATLLIVLIVFLCHRVAGKPSDAESKFVARAVELSQQSEREGQFPIGAVVVLDGRIIGEAKGGSGLGPASNHAEVKAMNMALKELAKSRFTGNEVLITTYEPCSMCRGMAEYFGLKEIRYTTQRPTLKVLSEYANFFKLFLTQQSINGSL